MFLVLLVHVSLIFLFVIFFFLLGDGPQSVDARRAVQGRPVVTLAIEQPP